MRKSQDNEDTHNNIARQIIKTKQGHHQKIKKNGRTHTQMQDHIKTYQQRVETQ